MTAKKYRSSDEVERIAEHLIQTVPDHFALDQCRIEYVMVDPPPKRHGRVTLGTAQKIAGLHAYFVAGVRETELTIPPALFVITISAEPWSRMSDGTKAALVDHELCHCSALMDERGDLQLGLNGHDVEEFRGVVARHGLWRDDLRDLFETAEQLSLDVGAS